MFKTKRLHHKCPCRIEKSHPRGQNSNQDTISIQLMEDVFAYQTFRNATNVNDIMDIREIVPSFLLRDIHRKNFRATDGNFR